jgi:hypothetical protein
MRIKKIRNTFSIGISLAICVLSFVACNNDNSVGNNPAVFAPVTTVELSVDRADFTGACPHTFKFTGAITTSAAGTVAYRFTDFETSNKDGSVDFSAAGTQTVTEEFVLTRSGALDVILEIPRQNFLSSNTVSITASCTSLPTVNIAGLWTGTFNVDDTLSDCDPAVSLPAEVTFTQNGSIVTGTLEARGPCGLGYPFQGTMNGNTLTGSLGGGLVPPGKATGILSGSTLEITTYNGYGSNMGTMHLHR